MHLAKAIVETLKAEGVDIVFGLMGGGVEEILALAVEDGIRYIQARHEQGAVGMADGYHRATGRIGVAVVSHGAGLANAATPMIVARKARSQVLVITSDTGADEPFMPHDFDQESFLASTIGHFRTIRSVSVAERDLTETFLALSRGDGPVALNLPTPIAEAEVPATWHYTPAKLQLPLSNPEPAAAAVTSLVGALVAAERPLLLAGAGAVAAGARSALVELAERTGAMLGETLRAKGYFAGHERRLGVSGGFGEPDTQAIMDQADLVVAFGASVSRYTTKWGTAFNSARIFTVDLRSEVRPQIGTAEVRIVADAQLTAAAVLANLPDSCASRDGWASVPSSPRPEWNATSEPLDLSGAIRRLDSALPANRALVVDGGNSIGPSAAHFSVREPGDQMLPWEFWSIGIGVPISVGAAIGRPDRLTVAFLGDGAFMLGLSDLDAAARAGAPLLMIVIDNSSLGAERTSLRALNLDPDLADVENPDLAAVARSLGFVSCRASTSKELDAAIDDLLGGPVAEGRPCFLSLVVDKDAPTPEMDRAFTDYRPI